MPTSLSELELSFFLDEKEADVFSQAKAQWFLGDWKALANLDEKTITAHAKKERLSLLVASAMLQLGRKESAERYIRLALNWGCSTKVVAQVLIAGVHNSLARASALKKDAERLKRHFNASVLINNSDLLVNTRAIREVLDLGLLPQAGALMADKFKGIKLNKTKPFYLLANIKSMQSELDLLHNQLSLALQRNQLYKKEVEDVNSYIAQPINNTSGVTHNSYSQLGQDLWVLEKTNFKKGGYFVEVGATDGILLSNTYLLENEFQWHGICAEPNPAFFDKLKQNRACIVDSSCIAGITGLEVDFILAKEYGCILDYASKDKHKDKRHAYLKQGKIIRIKTISLNDLLLKYNAPEEIDYISIDTEGNEIDILQAFPFDKWRVKLFSIEHNYNENRIKIQELFKNKGYNFVEKKWDDWFYIK